MRSTFLLAPTLALLWIGSSARGQDRVLYFDHAQKKEVEAAGAIEKESPAGIEIAGRRIPSNDVLDVIYDSLRQAKLDYTSASARERRAFDAALKDADRQKALADAVTAYQDALKNAPASAAKARRH